MRIFMLLILKSPMIYFDFDISPKEDKKLGEIQASQGFLVAENDKTGHDYDGITNIENAIDPNYGLNKEIKVQLRRGKQGKLKYFINN